MIVIRDNVRACSDRLQTALLKILMQNLHAPDISSLNVVTGATVPNAWFMTQSTEICIISPIVIDRIK